MEAMPGRLRDMVVMAAESSGSAVRCSHHPHVLTGVVGADAYQRTLTRCAWLARDRGLEDVWPEIVEVTLLVMRDVGAECPLCRARRTEGAQEVRS